MTPYHQLTIEEREKIQAGLWERRSLRGIARELGRNAGTISRELKRNLPPALRRYTPRLAQERADRTIRARGCRPRLKHFLIREYVVAKLQADYSPEQIAGTLSIEYPTYTISPEAIYQFIYAQYHRQGYGSCLGQDLRIYLKRHHQVRKLKYPLLKEAKGPIQSRIFIDYRPPEVAERIRLGHWEGDSMVSRQSSVGLNTLVERVTGLMLITKIKNTTAAETTKVVTERLKRFPRRLRQTITVDSGHENAGHEDIVKKIKTKIFFAHPYHSWERGINENANGLIRWYLPKGTDFATVSEERLRQIEYKLNTRPRKRLGWKTPLQVFNQGVALEC